MTKDFLLSLFAFVLLFGFSACNKSGTATDEDTPTSGTIKMVFDESVSPVFISEVETFHSLYKYSSIEYSVKSESEAFEDLLNKKVRAVVVTRELNDKEKKAFEDEKITPRSTLVAYDGIAFIVHPSNPDSQFSYQAILDILGGKTTAWNVYNPKSSLRDIQIVFDNPTSGTVRYIQDITGSDISKLKNVFAQKTNKAVIDYVAANPNSIGIIGAGWISDDSDSTRMSFLNKINVCGIMPKDTSAAAGNYYQPYQAYIAQKVYPFIRSVFIISREARAGLATGFTGFVSSDKGQRIVLRSGLVPATMPVRIVEPINQNIVVEND